MRIVEEFFAQGHANITATHPTTFEITKEPNLTRQGDCVIGVKASKGPLDFSDEFRGLCKRDGAEIRVTLEAAAITEIVEGKGSSGLTFRHPSESVGRKSSFTSDRTIMIRADRAARDLNKELIDALTSSETRLKVRISVEL